MSGVSIISYIILTISIVWAFIYPSFGEINALLGQKQKYSDSLIMMHNIESKKNDLLAKFNEISAENRKNIETVLPNSPNFVKLISEIDAVAAKYGISISKISFKEIDPSVGTSVENAAPSKPYSSALLGFSFNSPYDKFKMFMGDLGKSLRILDARSTKINVDGKGTYSYDVQFETYWVQ